MQVQGEHSAILSTYIKLQFVIKIFVLSIFERPFYTGFTVPAMLQHDSAVSRIQMQTDFVLFNPGICSRILFNLMKTNNLIINEP